MNHLVTAHIGAMKFVVEIQLSRRGKLVVTDACGCVVPLAPPKFKIISANATPNKQLTVSTRGLLVNAVHTTLRNHRSWSTNTDVWDHALYSEGACVA